MNNLSLSKNAIHLKILVVEDNSIVRKAQKYLFESLGFEVDVAEEGEKAIELFEPGKYVMVLLDIGLPTMSGYEVCDRFVAMEEGTSFHTPIIGISAHDFSKEKNVDLAIGMREILDKPLMLKQAQSLLQRYGILK